MFFFAHIARYLFFANTHLTVVIFHFEYRILFGFTFFGFFFFRRAWSWKLQLFWFPTNSLVLWCVFPPFFLFLSTPTVLFFDCSKSLKRGKLDQAMRTSHSLFVFFVVVKVPLLLMLSYSSSFFFLFFLFFGGGTGTLNYGSEGVIFGAKRMLRIVTSYGTSA